MDHSTGALLLPAPVRLKYEGLDADAHRIDAMQLGQSLQGSARLYNSIAHFWFTGQIPKRLVSQMRIQAGPPERGSISYAIYLAMVHGTLPMYPPLLSEFADLCIPAFVKSVFARRSGRPVAEVMKSLEVIDAMHDREHRMMEKVFDGQLATQARLLNVIDHLTNQNTGAMAQMSSPVGRTSRAMVHFEGRADEVRVDEPMAEVFRSKGDEELGDQATFRAKLQMIDKLAGTCKVQIDGADGTFKGKITDPALSSPGNIYTHAFDTDEWVIITAKPTLREGEIQRLYISDAKPDGHRPLAAE